MPKQKKSGANADNIRKRKRKDSALRRFILNRTGANRVTRPLKEANEQAERKRNR